MLSRFFQLCAVVTAISTLEVSAGTFQKTGDATQEIQQLQVGEYYKPSEDEGSGVFGNTAVFSRSPCPALNALANHGYLPRTGRDIGKAGLKSAIMDIFNMANDQATAQVAQVTDVFALDLLSQHNKSEHDASLVHTDAFFGFDPMEVNITLVEDLLGRADASGNIGVTAVAHVRKDRAQQCETSNPECIFGAPEKKKSFLQASLLLMALGKGDVISVDHARSFLVEEKIPRDFVKAASPLTVAALSAMSSKIEAEAA